MLLVSIGLLTFFVLLVLIWWYRLYFHYRQHMKYFKEFHHIPLLGIAYYIRNTTDFHEVLLSYTRKVGRNFWTMAGPFPLLFTSDPRIFSILKTQRCIDKPPLYKSLEKCIGNTLLLVNGTKWREQREILEPAFSYSLLKQNIPIYNKHADNFIVALKSEISKKSCEVDNILDRFIFTAVHETLVGTSIKGKEVEQCIENLHFFKILATDRYLRINEYFDFTYVLSKNFWMERKILRNFMNYLRGLLTNRKVKSDKLTKNIADKPILIDILLREIAMNKTALEDDYVKQLGFMIDAGFDTTAHTLAFIIFLLSKNPDAQYEAYKEIYSILGDDIHQAITQQHLKEMNYLDLVIKESLRIYTTTPMYPRELQKDIAFENTILPKGLCVIMLPYIMHQDPELYPNPEKFIPERFSADNLPSNQNSYAPFGLGKRRCIGKRFAELSMKVFLAKTLLNYELVNVQHELRLTSGVMLEPANGIRIGIKERK